MKLRILHVICHVLHIYLEKEKTIKEKELVQKQMDQMRAQLELAEANVGDVVQNPICTRGPCPQGTLTSA